MGLLGITKEVVGIHVPLTRSLFGGGILRRLPPRGFASETDFCSFAVLMAAQNEASICGSLAPIAARNRASVQFGTVIAVFKSLSQCVRPR